MEEEGACEECTKNCLLMHKRNLDPSSTVTTFFKVMIGDNYDKVLILPPRFADSVRNMAGQPTTLEDSSGEGWPVKFKKIDGLLGFEEGWEKFALDHRLQVGDLLVFHFIMKTHFVVVMYGKSGCPEIRHQLIETREKNKSAADNCRPSNVNTNGHHRVHKFSSQSDCSQQVTKINKKRKNKIADDCSPSNVNTNSHHRVHKSSSQLEHSQPMTKINKKKKGSIVDDCSPLDVNTNIHHHVHESSSQSERSQPVLKSKEKGNGDMVPPNGNATTSNRVISLSQSMTSGSDEESGQRSEPLIRNANHDTMVVETRHTSGPDKEMSQRSEPLFTGTPTTVKQSSLVQNNNGNIEDVCRKTNFKLNPDKSYSDPKKKAVAGGDSDETCDFRKQLNSRVEARKKLRASIVTPSEGGTSAKRLKIDDVPSTQGKMLKKEPDILGTRLHNGRRLIDSTKSLPKPIATRPKMPKKEPDTSDVEENGNSYKKVKVEPDDCYEEPLTGLTNSSFSAVMSSYRYLELPDWVKLSKVILLRNGSNRWPVLFETNLGLKALTQSWGLFAKERGIKPGDKCEFVRESEPRTLYNVYSVRITVL